MIVVLGSFKVLILYNYALFKTFLYKKVHAGMGLQ